MASIWIAAFASHDAAGTLYINTLGVKQDTTGGSEMDGGDLASAVKDWLATDYRACLSPELTLDSITVRKMPEPTTEEGVAAVGLAGTGPDSATLPRELAIILSWKTDHPGRSGRGHIALPAPQAAGLLSSPASYNVGAAYFTGPVTTFLNALGAGHDVSGLGGDTHISHVVWSAKDAAGYDVVARLIRPGPRWVQRRQTAP
jgi:hypothetical protein